MGGVGVKRHLVFASRVDKAQFLFAICEFSSEV